MTERENRERAVGGADTPRDARDLDEAVAINERIIEQNDGLYAAVLMGGNMQRTLAEALRELVEAQFQADRMLDRARGEAREALAEYDAGRDER